MVKTFSELVSETRDNLGLKEAMLQASIEKTRQWAINKGYAPQNESEMTKQEVEIKRALNLNTSLTKDEINEVIAVLNQKAGMNIKPFPKPAKCEVFKGSCVKVNGTPAIITDNGCTMCGNPPEYMDSEGDVSEYSTSDELEPMNEEEIRDFYKTLAYKAVWDRI